MTTLRRFRLEEFPPLHRIPHVYGLDSYRAMSKKTEGQKSPHRERKQLEAEILRLYPNIPEQDLRATLDHTLEGGSQRVGTNTNLSLSDRAKRAVRAHVKADARYSVESKIRIILQVWSRRR